jgi:hypothetical protein
LRGDNGKATQQLRLAIDRGFRDGPALRRDLAWHALVHDAAFGQQQQRLASLLAAEREHMAPVPALQ